MYTLCDNRVRKEDLLVLSETVHTELSLTILNADFQVPQGPVKCLGDELIELF